MGGGFFVVPMLADFALRSPQWRAHLDFPEIHSPTVLLKSQLICNREVKSEVQRRCSPNITNHTYQLLHAQITTSLTRPCRVISLHQIEMVRNGLQIATVKSYCVFNVFARNSSNITNYMHQFLHAIVTSLTRPCHAISHGDGSAC